MRAGEGGKPSRWIRFVVSGEREKEIERCFESERDVSGVAGGGGKGSLSREALTIKQTAYIQCTTN